MFREALKPLSRAVPQIDAAGETDRCEAQPRAGDSYGIAGPGDRTTVAGPGHPPADLPPSAVRADTSTLLKRWCHLPNIDPVRLRSDIDNVVDPKL